VGLAPARVKEMAAKKNGNGVKVVEAAAVATTLGSEVAGGHDGEQLSDEGVENGHDLDASGFLAESETGSFADESVEVLVTEPEDEHFDEDTNHEEEPSAEVVVEGAELSLTASPGISSSPTLAPEDPSHELEAASETEVVHLGNTSRQNLDEPGTPRPALGKELPVQEVKPQAGTDIHDIVNLLETTSAIPSIPDDAPDIPDED
jgi:hypothetical protein